MSKIIRQIKRYIVSFAAFALNILLWLWLLIFIKPTGDSLVLHYNIYFGIDQIGPGIKLYLLPLFGLIIVVVNLLFIMSNLAHNRLRQYAAWLSLIIQVLLIASLLLLVINHY